MPWSCWVDDALDIWQSPSVQLLSRRFDVGQLLGKGGQAAVYEAFDRRYQIPVAVKLYSEDVDVDALTREFRSVCDIVHPNLLRIYELVVEENRAFLVLELFDGHLGSLDLEGMTNEEVRNRLSEIEHGMLAGLACLNSHGVVHGDIKPSNVLTKEGRVVLSDFGLSRRTTSRSGKGLSGTPLYSAPELFQGAQPSFTSDLFATGVVLVELASGKLPWLEWAEGEAVINHPWLEDTNKLHSVFPHSCERILQLLESDPDTRLESIPRPSLELQNMEVIEGREDELDLIKHLANRALDMKKVLRLDVVGTSGMGKSRLLEEVQKRAPRWSTTILVRCHCNEGLPFAVADALLEQLGSSSRDADPLEKEAARLRQSLFLSSRQPDTSGEVVSRVIAFVEKWSRERGLILLVDDAHWGDEDSGRLFRAVISATNIGFLLCVAYRPSESELPKDTFLAPLRGHTTDATINLSPLAHDAILRLVRSRAGRSDLGVPDDLVIKHCQGLPVVATFLDVEDYREDKPFASRLTRLPEGGLELCLLLKAAGFPLSREVLLSIGSKNGRDAFGYLLEQGWLRRAGGQDEVELRHERWLESEWKALSTGAQQRFHAALADALRDTGAPPGQIAVQAHLAGDLNLAAKAAKEAADQAFDVRAFRRAAQFEAIVLEEALAEGRSEEVLSARRRLSRAFALLGDGRRAAEQQLKVAEACSEWAVKVAEEIEAAKLLLSAGELKQGAALVEKVAERLGMMFPRSSIARILSMFWERLRLFGINLSNVEINSSRDPYPRSYAELYIEFDYLLAFYVGVYEAHPGAQARLVRNAVLTTRRSDDLVRALSLELAHGSLFGFSNKWLSDVRSLLMKSEKDASPLARSMMSFALGFADFCIGAHKQADERFATALRLAAHERSAPWFTDLTRLYRLGVGVLEGEMEEVITQGFAVRRIWLAENKEVLVSIFDIIIGIQKDLRAGKAQEALRRLRRAALGPGTSVHEYIRVLNISRTLQAAGHARWARRVLWRYRGILAVKSIEDFGRIVVAWAVFTAFSDVKKLSRVRRWLLLALARWCATSRHPAGKPFASLMRSVIALRQQERTADAIRELKVTRDTFMVLGLAPHAGGVDEILIALGEKQTSNLYWEQYPGAPKVWRRFFGVPWPEMNR